MKTAEDIKNKIKEFETELTELRLSQPRTSGKYLELVLLTIIRILEWVLKDAE